MEIKHKNFSSQGVFYIETDGEVLGEMVYKNDDNNNIVIQHTEVSEKLRGKGAGKQLVNASVEYARKNNLKIIPRCSFARDVFERVKEYQDVLAPQ
ncbi:GNAT family N-acetyltransferase [Chryseosolibacter indicus]|uniref:N-acetyltransferase n=1 Tax=Chryseosolibacter indicus TaxID=2782351 RepID=A0ABS5VQW6_9BACT|nr:GNAT family N-acetyltransferase [Chryseosolibacter indicus]MBT1703177.1 N-acetyltransferase [Chryseosolibacter indicus]